MAETLRTPIGVLSYPHLFEPVSFQGGEPRYSLVIVFDANARETAEYMALAEAVKAVAREKWGDKVPGNIRWPFRKNSEKQAEPFISMENGFFISPWTKQKPGLVDQNTNEIIMPDDVFAGQKVRATVRPFAYSASGNNGVSFGLQNVQVVVDPKAQRLDGRRAATADFDSVDGPPTAGNASDPFTGAEESMPF